MEKPEDSKNLTKNQKDEQRTSLSLTYVFGFAYLLQLAFTWLSHSYLHFQDKWLVSIKFGNDDAKVMEENNIICGYSICLII